MQCRSHDHIRHFHSLKLLFMLHCSQLSAKVKRRIRTAVVSSSALSEMMFWDLNFNVCYVYLITSGLKYPFYEHDFTFCLALIHTGFYYFYSIFVYIDCSYNSLNNFSNQKRTSEIYLAWLETDPLMCYIIAVVHLWACNLLL